jgi:formylglycine-generating enzyme required for sulfatase activity
MNKDGEILQDEWKYALEGALYDNECRLPTEVEWEYAAYGLDSDEGIYEQTNMYPWQGTQMRSFEEKKEKERGKFYANFLRGRGDPIGVQLNGTLTMPVYSFQPNSFGLYNMAGNVNEWVKDVFRANVANVDEINSYRGNEFESDSLYAEEILTKHFAYLDPAMRDSMRSVLIAERGITKTGGDYRDFKDGDTQSSLNNDSSLIYKDITPIEQANVISNTARVYKGGGWNDRAIWLNPSQRRWLDERQCRNDIGFRCVMSTVGGFEQTREYESK